jgi:microcystin-dependent protein
MDAFIGTILPVAFNFAPNGWFMCQGQLLPISQYQALYALLGTAYGGNGTSTFGLPSLQSRVPIGFGQGAGLSNYPLGQVGGVEGVTLLSTQMPMHNHAATATNAVSGGVSGATLNVSNAQADTATPVAGSTIAAPGTGGGRSAFSAVNGFVASAPNTALNGGSISISSTPIAVNSTINVAQAGGGLSHENRQPFLAINYIICWSGIFPSRP